MTNSHGSLCWPGRASLCPLENCLNFIDSCQQAWNGMCSQGHFKLLCKNVLRYNQVALHKRCGFDPQIGVGKWQPTPGFLPESDTTECTHTHTYTHTSNKRKTARLNIQPNVFQIHVNSYYHHLDQDIDYFYNVKRLPCNPMIVNKPSQS